MKQAKRMLKHDFTDFVLMNGRKTCKYCHMTRDNDKLPTYCYAKTEATDV